MKRILAAILACLLLCGCGSRMAETTEPSQHPAVAPTEPAGSYAPGSKIELATNGAVRAYPQNLDNVLAIKMMGEDVLVFSGSDTTTITRLTGENLFRIAEKELDLFLPADAPSLYISDDRVGYYDHQSMELVFLDETLREIKRISMPEDMVGDPILTAERNLLYYCTDTGVRVMDMESGISRLLKEMSFAYQVMDGLMLNGTVLRLKTGDESGNSRMLFLDAATGAMVGEGLETLSLTSGGGYFYAIDPEGVVDQMIFGNGESIQQLNPEDYLTSGIFLPEVHGAVVFDRENDAITLDYYDLSTGLRTSALKLEAVSPESLIADGKGNVYFLTATGEKNQSICRWNLAATPTADERVYTGPRYTMDAPDTAGLSECRDYAVRLSQQHGLEIKIILDSVDVKPSDYDLVPEYQVPVILDALAQLEEILAHYPEGVFEKAVEGMEDGALTLCLVREVRGSYESGSLDTVDGLHFWVDDHSYVAIAMGEKLEPTFYHEMFHAMESRLLSESIALYRWDELNPKGFDYDYDYIANQSRDGSEYLEDTTRSFIDTYSMSFPKEDRARVMEYGCMPGNENYFISYTMQKKLRAICEGIRDAYGLTDHPEPLLWEQYLEAPIAP